MYVDGNTGSMIAQALVAGTAGVAVAGAAVWSKVKSPLRRNKGAATGDTAQSDTTTEQ